MILPGGDFEARREAAVNNPTFRVALDLGNLALVSKGAGAVASTEFSSDWPARGVVDGDRAHINAGPAASADNGVGQSVWQGSVVSGAGGTLPAPEVITIDLGIPKMVNRLSLIFWPSGTLNGNLGAIAPADFLIEIGTSAIPDTGFGDDGFGIGPFGGTTFVPWTALRDKNSEVGRPATPIVAGQVTGNTNDYCVFEEVGGTQLIQYIRITVTKLQAVGVRTRVVAIEATRAVDITQDVCAINRQRHKDYALNNRVSTTLGLTLRNYDRKYSPKYVPTVAEVAAGFFNSLLRPSLELRVFAGFSGIESQMFRGYIDNFTPQALTRTVKIRARDYIKFFIKNKLTSNLRSNQPLEANAEYLANRKNFPSNLMILDSTTLTAGYFMPSDAIPLDEMQNLGNATGDSEIYMDEFGRYNFRSYLTLISHIYALLGAADLQSGTLINTDATTVPGEVDLLKVVGLYVKEGTWTSPLSPVLTGKVWFSRFNATYQTGPATSIDFFIRVTNDGGATFTPWREIIPSAFLNNLTKWNHGYSQIQIQARLRSSSTSQTPKLFGVEVHYQSRGGSQKYPTSAQFTVRYDSTMRDVMEVLTDEVGGQNYMITRAIVKSNPTFLAPAAQDAWIGTYGKNKISATNPLPVPVGQTAFAIDFGKTKYSTPQTVVMTLGTAVATAVLTSHPTKPVLTINCTVAGTITALKVTGTPFSQNGTVQAESDATQEIIDDYGELEDVLSNDYIDNVDLAQDIANNRIQRFSAPIDYLQEVPMQFSPNIQINDRATVVETNAGLDYDYFVIGATDDIVISSGMSAQAETKLEMVAVTENFALPDPAYYGSAGVFYYDNFRFGGQKGL